MGCFPGDDNFVLWRIQHDAYPGPKGVGLLYAEAELRYSAAIHLLSVTTDLWDAIKQHDGEYYSRKKNSEREVFRRTLNVVATSAPARGRARGEQGLLIGWFDHRVLRPTYDTIAAAFRFHNPDLWLPLFSRDEAVKEMNLWAWESFWEAEVKRLVQNDKIVVAVLTAVAFQNEEAGFTAEQELAELLSLEYKVLSVAVDRDNNPWLGQ
jgi:hypothetical protein